LLLTQIISVRCIEVFEGVSHFQTPDQYFSFLCCFIG